MPYNRDAIELLVTAGDVKTAGSSLLLEFEDRLVDLDHAHRRLGEVLRNAACSRSPAKSLCGARFVSSAQGGAGSSR
jgi:hypothetical protein